jgi:ketosteroid isomerase-like protein
VSYFKALLLIVISFILSGCHRSIDVEKEKAGILAANEAVRQAHFEHDAAKFLSQNAQEWFSVRDGTVSLKNKESYREGLDQYLKSVDFSEVTSLTPPEIKISDDGTMAWLIGNVRVTGTQKQGDGSYTSINFVSAWLAVYEKQEGAWRLVASAITEKKGD